MMILPFLRQLHVVGLILVIAFTLGCENYLVVTTATKFGLEIAQVANEPPKVSLGYKREEATIIPAEHRNATDDGGAGSQTDTYSVLAEFCVMANPSLWDFIRALSSTTNDVPDSLQIRSFFATGIAAARAADSVQTRQYFRDNILERTGDKRAKKRCF